jgi:hypothetical protein
VALKVPGSNSVRFLFLGICYRQCLQPLMHPNPQNLHELKIHIQDAFDTFAMQMSSVRNENDLSF